MCMSFNKSIAKTGRKRGKSELKKSEKKLTENSEIVRNRKSFEMEEKIGQHI